MAYLLWPTLVGHRWYVGKVSPLYTLTLGYFGIMWFADLFRIPVMVREYNSYLYQRRAAQVTEARSPSSDVIFTKVVGVTKGEDRQDLIAYLKAGEELVLKRDRENEFDKNAIKVLNKEGEQLGWINRELAAELAPELDAGREFKALVTEVTGGTEDKPTLGCNICLLRLGESSKPLTTAEKVETPTEKALRWAEPTISVMEQLARTWDGVRAKWASSKKFKVLTAAAAILVIVALLSAIVSKKGGEETQTSAAVTAETEEKGLSISLKTPSGLTLTSPSFTIEGVTEPGARITVLGCANAPVRVQADEDGKFSAGLTMNEGTNTLTVTAEKDGRRGSASCSLTYRLDEASYKAQCKAIEFKVLNKNPDAYKGQKYFATGQVVQIMENFGTTDIRLNVTRDQWGYWDDTIYVTFKGTVPAYEDSIIRVWGEIKGSYTYTSVAGWNITLPWVEARYIEVVQP